MTDPNAEIARLTAEASTHAATAAERGHDLARVREALAGFDAFATVNVAPDFRDVALGDLLRKVLDAFATSRSENGALHVEGERLAAELAASEVAQLRLIGERDAARSQLRRAQDQRLTALFLSLADTPAVTITAAEQEAIRVAIDEAEEPVALPCPGCCMVDGQPDHRALFRLGEYLRGYYGTVAQTFYLRAPREATPTAEAVEAAIMCRRVGA